MDSKDVTMQGFEQKNAEIRDAFLTLKRDHPGKLEARLNLSWSNWGFGLEELATSVRRLADNDIGFIELHGNHYGPDIGYDAAATNRLLGDHGMACSGICGMFSPDNEMASNRAVVRQRAVDYIKRTVEFAVAVEANYILVVPAAVGRPTKIDDCEFERSVATLQSVAHLFEQAGIRAAIEPIRAAEVSICHTVEDALAYIAAVDHPGVQHINGDVYHMQVSESHIAAALRSCGERLANLHLADSNRCALGEGSLDIDTMIMALYLIGFNNASCFATPEPLGPGGDPYPAMYGKPEAAVLDQLVSMSARTWREREEAVRAL
jgi:sugar phosphate isomerase/epimerase